MSQKPLMHALYKFVGNAAVARSILGGAVKFTPISGLNDPAELNPTLNQEAVAASLSRLRAGGYSDEDMVHLRRQGAVLQALAPRYQVLGVPSSREEATKLIQSRFYDSTSTLDRLLTQTAHEIASKVGVFCLSRRFDSLPMWAHYAGNATGFAVEFTKLESVFRGDPTGVLRELREVIYEQEIEGVTFDPKSHESLFFSKYLDWSYEQEVRVVLPLADCRKQKLSSGDLFLYSLPIDCVSRVILGWNMEPASVALIMEAVANVNPRIEVAHARFVRGKVSLMGHDSGAV